MSALIEAAGIEVEPIWPTLFAKALAGKDIGALLFNVGSGAAAAPAAGGAAPAAAAAGGAPAAAAKEEKKKEEAKEESDDDMGFGLFD
jgi:large subunit ribosomal protein LP1